MMRPVGAVLAGGLSRRMGGGDKALAALAGEALLAHVIRRARPQVARLVLNANGDAARFAEFGLPVVADGVPGRAGPLAGVLAAMEWAARRAPETALVATFPADSPFVPADFVERLRAALGPGRPLARATSAGRVHPVAGLWPVALRGDLRRALVEDGVRKVDEWTARHGVADVEFPAAGADPFFNVNRPEDLARAEALLAATSRSRRPTDSEFSDSGGLE